MQDWVILRHPGLLLMLGAALALCLTTMCPSYLNDSYFHVVTSFSGMDIKTSLKTWSVSTFIIPAVGSVILIILSLFIH